MTGWEIAGWGVAILVWLAIVMMLIGFVRKVRVRMQVEAQRQKLRNQFQAETGKDWKDATMEERILWGTEFTMKELIER